MTGRKARADEITAQLADDIPSGETINRTRRSNDKCLWTLKYAMTQLVPTVTVKYIQHLNQHQEQVSW
jgi:hypothetical protein